MSYEPRPTDPQPLLDGLTGLPSPAAWEEILRVEDSRRRRYGSSAGMLLVELTADEPHAIARLAAAGEILMLAVRETDPVARVGERRLGILAVPCDGGLDVLTARLRQQLAADGIDATVTARTADLGERLPDAWRALERSVSRPLRAVK